jgi:hypothetical protein
MLIAPTRGRGYRAYPEKWLLSIPVPDTYRRPVRISKAFPPRK